MAGVANNLIIGIRNQGGQAAANAILGVGRAAASILPNIHAVNGLLGQNAQKAQQYGNNVLQFHQRIVGLIASLYSANLFRKYLDTAVKIENRLAQVTEGSGNLAAVQGRLFDVAQNTRQSFEGTVELYTRMGLATRELGLSQERLIAFTERVNKAVAISGANGHEAYAGLVQFSQGLASGRLQGDELRSVLEGLPTLADAIAKGLGVARGELRELGKQGKLTAENVIKAIEAASYIDIVFGKAKPTISQAFTILENEVVKAVGELNKAYNVSETIAGAIIWISQNLQQVVGALAGIGAAALSAFAPGAIADFSGRVLSLFKMLNKHPFVAIASALIGLGTYLYITGDAFSFAGGSAASMKDAVVVAVQDIVDAFNGFVQWLSSIDIVGYWSNLFSGILGPETLGAFSTFFTTTETGFAGWLQKIAKFLDVMAVIVRTVINFMIEGFMGIPDRVATSFKDIANKMIQGLENLGNFAIRGVNRILESLGSEKRIDTIDLKSWLIPREDWERNGLDMAKIWVDSFQTAIHQQDSGFEKWVDGYIGRVREAGEVSSELRRIQARDRGANQTLLPGGPKRPTPPDENALKKAMQEYKRMKKEFEGLVFQLDPIAEANEKIFEGERILAWGRANKLIPTTAEYNRLLGQLNEQYRDARDPMGAFIRELEREAKYLSMGVEEREREKAIWDATEDQRKKGVIMTDAVTASIRRQVTAMQERRKIAAIEDQIFASSVANQSKQQMLELETFMRLYKSGEKRDGIKLTQQDFINKQFETMNGLGLETAPGTFLGENMRVQQEEQAYAAIEKLRQLDLLNEQQAAVARQQIYQRGFEVQMGLAAQFFGDFKALSESEHQALANIGKAAAIAEATIHGITTVTKTLATYGYTPVGIALATAAGVAAAANVAKIAQVEFATGGYTGDFGRSAPAGTVHGQEYVINAQQTAKYRPMLEQINAGTYQHPVQAPVVGAAPTNLSVNIQNEIPGAEFEVTQIDESTVEVIARRVVRQEADQLVANSIKNPSSKTSRSLAQNTKTTRQY